MVFVLSACKNSSAVVVGADGKEYELVENKNGNNVSASLGGIIVAVQYENGNAVTTVLSDNHLVLDEQVYKYSFVYVSI